MQTRKLLIVSYLFPPAGGIAVQRVLSLAKYLPACGYEVHILRAGNAAVPVRDPELLRQVPGCVHVHSAFTPEIPFNVRQRLWGWLAPKNGSATGPTPDVPRKSVFASAKSTAVALCRRLLCPEPEVLWVPFAVRKARQIVRRHRIDAVVVTVPPFSALLVGSALKRAFPEVKLISDFRDEWLKFYLKDFDFQNNAQTRRRAEAIEREAVELSDLVVAVAGSSLEVIRGRYPEQPDQKFALVPNGYDPEAFAGFGARPSGTTKMVVTHVGTAYKTATPRYYLDALESMPDSIRQQIETRFVGRVSEGERAVFRNRSLPPRVLGFMPQARALEYMEETDFLLLTMTDEISLPGKLFEYMATAKPILAITPPGSEVDRILRTTGAGWSADPRDPAAIQAMIARAYEMFRSGRAGLITNREAIQRYERPRLAAEYGTVIRQLFAPDAISAQDAASPGLNPKMREFKPSFGTHTNATL